MASGGQQVITYGAGVNESQGSASLPGKQNLYDLHWSMFDQIAGGTAPGSVIPTAAKSYWQVHTGGANYACADTHVKYLKPTALVTANNGDSLSWNTGLDSSEL